MVLGDGSGHAHPVYIDNLVDGLLLTAVHPQAANEAFNMSDPPIPWRASFNIMPTWPTASCATRRSG
jgi:nucleoside-diphosphate-sugar epimerase